MGYTKSEFFIVHDRDKPAVRRAHERAVEIFGSLVGPIMSASINFQDGFIVWTSGSKAGWPEAEEHSARIERLIEAMSKLEHPPRWVLASAGDDIDDMAIEQGYDGNWDHVYKRSSFGVTPGGKTGEG